jgi:hypothetical protein
MTALYAIALLAGLLALLTWIAATAIAASVAGKESLDPEQRFGRSGRFLIAGVMAFGLAGMSATFAGWEPALAFAAAAAGATLGVTSAALLGPVD